MAMGMGWIWIRKSNNFHVCVKLISSFSRGSSCWSLGLQGQGVLLTSTLHFPGCTMQKSRTRKDEECRFRVVPEVAMNCSN